jgi:hypothetical protein
MTVEERLEKLEIELTRARRGNRLLLAGVMLTFVLLAAAMTAGIASREDVINAKQFNLLDDNGKTRAVLSADKDEPRLTLLDVDGNTRVLLSVNKDRSLLTLSNADGLAVLGVTKGGDVVKGGVVMGGPQLTLSDTDRKPRVMLTADKDEALLGLYSGGKFFTNLFTDIDGTRLVMKDADGKARVALGVANGNSQLNLWDGNGKFNTYLTAHNNAAALTLNDADGKTRVSLNVIKEGPSLFLSGADEKPRVSLLAMKDGPGLRLFDADGTIRAVLGTTQTDTPDGKVISYPESSLFLFNPDGKVRWQALP